MTKVTSLEDVFENIHDNQTIMIGGFGEAGYPHDFIEALIGKGLTGLTVISNDAGTASMEKGSLMREMISKTGMVSKYIVSHIGMNPEMAQRMNTGEFEVEFIPMGTLVERIRCAGAGIGGFLTPTGLGTIVADGKKIIEAGGKNYLLEEPLHADIALVKAYKADTSGNLILRRSARNFNPVMATAAKFVAAEAEQIVETGSIDPDEVHIPGIFIDKVIHSRHG